MQKSSFLSIAVVLLAAATASAGESQLNVNGIGRQRAPVALLEQDGTARVIWENTELGILARVIPAGDPGTASTEESLLLENTHLASIPGEGIVITHRQPIALSDGNGGFWLVWTRQRDYLKSVPFWERREALSQEIRLRRFDRDGKQVGTERIVAWAGKTKSQATAIHTSDGGFVVAWTSSDEDATTNSRDGIFARWFDREGTPVSPVTRVSSVEDGELASWPALALDATGRLLVVWHAPDGSSTGIFSRLFDENRVAVDEPPRANLNPVGAPKPPGVLALE